MSNEFEEIVIKDKTHEFVFYYLWDYIDGWLNYTEGDDAIGKIPTVNSFTKQLNKWDRDIMDFLLDIMTRPLWECSTVGYLDEVTTKRFIKRIGEAWAFVTELENDHNHSLTKLELLDFVFCDYLNDMKKYYSKEEFEEHNLDYRLWEKERIDILWRLIMIFITLITSFKSQFEFRSNDEPRKPFLRVIK